MKKYEKPAIEEINIGAPMPLMTSITGDVTVSDETGYDTDNFAPGRKDKEFDDEGW